MGNGVMQFLKGLSGYENDAAQDWDRKHNTYLFDILGDKYKNKRIKEISGEEIAYRPEQGPVAPEMLTGSGLYGTPYEQSQAKLGLMGLDSTFTAPLGGSFQQPEVGHLQKIRGEDAEGAATEESYGYTQEVPGATGRYELAGVGPAYNPDSGGSGEGSMPDPVAVDAAARAIIAGHASPDDYGKRGKVKLAITKRVLELSPGFNLIQSDANAKYLKLSQSLNTIGQSQAVIPLFIRVDAAVDELANMDNHLINWAKNGIGAITGDPRIYKLREARDNLVIEAQRVMSGSSAPSQARMQRLIENLDNNLSPAQFKAASGELRHAMEAAIESRKSAPYNPVAEDQRTKEVNWEDLP